jgi:hypothetical protein
MPECYGATGTCVSCMLCPVVRAQMSYASGADMTRLAVGLSSAVAHGTIIRVCCEIIMS